MGQELFCRLGASFVEVTLLCHPVNHLGGKKMHDLNLAEKPVPGTIPIMKFKVGKWTSLRKKFESQEIGYFV